jgi:hypothetical protein
VTGATRTLAVCGALGLVTLAACTPVAPAFLAVETELAVGVGSSSASLPAIEVRRGDGSAFVRDDWVVAETAARDHCAAQGTSYARLPPARDHTQIRLDDGVYYFMSTCAR